MKALKGKFTIQPTQGGFMLPHGAKIDKAGYILKQSSNSLLQRERWKRRFCILSDGKLYYYQKEPRTSAQKPSGIIFLEHYDVCREATAQERQKQKGFIFTLQCTDKICLGKDKYMFCVDTDEDMSTWLYHLMSSTRRVQTRKKSHGSREQYQCHLPPQPKPNNENTKRASEPALFVATKYRAKGPKGRRLPSRKSAVPNIKHTACRTASLSALHEEDQDVEEPMLRSSSSVELAYKYSSSNDDSDDEDRLRGRKPRCRSELDRPLSAVCPLLDDDGKEIVIYQGPSPNEQKSPEQGDVSQSTQALLDGESSQSVTASPANKKASLNVLLSKMGEITERLTGLQDIILDISGESPQSSPEFKKKMADIKDKLSTVAQVVIGLIIVIFVFFGLLLADIIMRNF